MGPTQVSFPSFFANKLDPVDVGILFGYLGDCFSLTAVVFHFDLFFNQKQCFCCLIFLLVSIITVYSVLVLPVSLCTYEKHREREKERMRERGMDQKRELRTGLCEFIFQIAEERKKFQ